MAKKYVADRSKRYGLEATGGGMVLTRPWPHLK